MVVPGIAVTLLFETARRSRRQTVGPVEARLFRSVNRLPGTIESPVWALMQTGSLGAVFALSGVLLRTRGRHDAVVAALAGCGVWAGAKLVKVLVGRARPADVFDGVNVRGQRPTGLGYPSGHTAVASTLALIAASEVGPTCRPAAIAVGGVVGGVVGGARMYVGAHLPLDVVGGLTLGAIVGTAATSLVDGSP